MAQQYLHIPTPCHENWDAMTSSEQGKFCASCLKQVVDFSEMTDKQILDQLSKASGKTCGRFTESQLERPLQPEIPFNIRPYKLLLSSLLPGLLIAGTASSQTGPNKITSNTQRIVKDPPLMLGMIMSTVVQEKTITGSVKDENGKPVARATIQIKGTGKKTLADAAGKFSLTHSAGNTHQTLVISSPGFATSELPLGSEQSAPITIYLRATHTERKVSSEGSQESLKPIKMPARSADTVKPKTVKGKVTDLHGNPLPFATVTHDGETQIVTDSVGGFIFPVTSLHPNATFLASHVGFQQTSIAVDLHKTEEITLVVQESSQLEAVTVQGFSSTCRSYTVGEMRMVRSSSHADTIRSFIDKVFHNELFRAYPNPARKGQTITMVFKKAGNYTLQLSDNSGKLYLHQDVRIEGEAVPEQLTIPANISAGVYYLKAMNGSSGKYFIDKIIVQ